MRQAMIVLLLGIVMTGCASYVTPGRGADLGSITSAGESQIREALAKKPLAKFPTGIAMARVQAPKYHSYTARGWGHGKYSLVTTRDIEQPEQLERLTRMPQVQGVAPLNRLLVSPELQSDRELREAAAKLHADVVLIYTIDTAFDTRDKSTPLTVVSLGLSPTQEARVTTTASAILIDTRNGYVYGAAEATEQQSQAASAWTSSNAIDAVRLRTESQAFDKLVGEIETMWNGVVVQYAKNP